MRGARVSARGALAGALAAGVVLAASAVAGIPGAGGVISGCVGKNARTSGTGLLGPTVTLDRAGTLRAIDAETGQSCAADETSLSWNVQGSPGPAGPRGPSDMWANEYRFRSEDGSTVTEPMFRDGLQPGDYLVTVIFETRRTDASVCKLAGGVFEHSDHIALLGPDSKQVTITDHFELPQGGSIPVTCYDFDTLAPAFGNSFRAYAIKAGALHH